MQSQASYPDLRGTYLFMQLLCSTGAFSRLPDFTDYHTILEYGPRLPVDGFELMFYPAWYDNLERIAEDLCASGLRFPAMHTEKGIGLALGNADSEVRAQGVQRLAANCQLASLIGSKVLVLHLWGWPDLDNNLDNNLLALHECLDVTERYGIELAIETIPGRHFDPLHNVHRAIQLDKRGRVALDTEFLERYEQLATIFSAEWLWQGDYVRHVHIKDFDGEPFSANGRRKYLHPGEGRVDFAHFFAGLKACGFDSCISLEAAAIDGTGTIDVERLQKSLRMLRAMIDE